MSLSHWYMARRVDQYRNGAKAQHTDIRHSWIVQDSKGAIEFHINIISDNEQLKKYGEWNIRNYGIAHMAGIEVHTPAKKEDEHSLQCEILCGYCQANGTSLGGCDMMDVMYNEIDEVYIYNELEKWHQESFGLRTEL